jgi:uncharacterized membrane protein
MSPWMDAAAADFSSAIGNSASLLPLQVLDFFPVLHHWCCERFMRKKKKKKKKQKQKKKKKNNNNNNNRL